MLEIHQISILKDNYVYVIHNNKSDETAVVDPGRADPVLHFLQEKGWGCDYIINTHHHWDHTDGNAEIKAKTGAKIIGFANDSHRIPEIDIKIQEGEELEICGSKAKILFLPGHTLGHIGYYFAKEKALFSGDVIFAMGCGRLFEGSAEQAYGSLQKIAKLPLDTKIYCAHEYSLDNAEFALTLNNDNRDLQYRYENVKKLREKNKPTIPTNIAIELKTNPFLRAENVDEFARVRKIKDNF